MKANFKIDEVVFNTEYIGFHLDLAGALTIHAMKRIAERLINSFWVQLYSARKADASFSTYGGRFNGKWYVSFPISLIGFESLLEEYDCVQKDGQVYVIKDVRL